MVVTVVVLYQARVFATAIHFNPSRTFAGKAGCLPLEWSSMRATYFYEKSSCLLVETSPVTNQWPMGGKAKSRCRLGMLNTNKLRHSYFNVVKLENYGPAGECLSKNH